MVTVCLTCGDEGWDNALVYCVKCLNEAVHRYCLDKVPETYDKMNEYVRWVCDNCEAQSDSIHSTSDAKTQGETEQIEVDSIVTLNKERISHLTARVENGHCKNGAVLQRPHKELDCSKDPEIVGHYRPSGAGTNSKDDYSHMVLVENEPISPINSSQLHEATKVEVVANGPSRRAKMRKLNDSSLFVTTDQCQSADSVDEDAQLGGLSSLSTNLNNSAEQRCEDIPTLQYQREGNNTGHEREADPIVESSLASCNKNKADIFAEQRCENIPTLEPHRDLNDTNKNDADNELRCENLLTLQPHKEGNASNHESEGDPTADLSSVSCNKNDADSISQPPIEAQAIVTEGEQRVWAKPLVDPIWRGKFNILNQDDTVEGLAAHLSSKACRMVFTEASMLPTPLPLQILPRAVVWPKTFEKSAPNDDHIALYIFPKNSRYASSFDLLVTKMAKSCNEMLYKKCRAFDFYIHRTTTFLFEIPEQVLPVGGFPCKAISVFPCKVILSFHMRIPGQVLPVGTFPQKAMLSSLANMEGRSIRLGLAVARPIFFFEKYLSNA